ncbi:MAG TPA: carboxypeptidase-like regulatory domain-containing protein [bacterium]|nr:carboxypeptidase-like regulatory domain-containing protein [bacterium]
MKKISLIAFLMIISLLFISCGKGLIVGRVIDENNDPLSGVLVVTEPPTYSKITSPEGYEMKNIPVGVYEITASKTGYSTKKVEVKVFKNRATQADIQLKKTEK